MLRAGRFALLGLLPMLAGLASADFTATFLHTNDLHSHVEATKVRDEMLGGYARHATILRQLKKDSTNPILLNAGDVFQGTLYFQTYSGLADLAYMDYVGYQAMAVGNHEFDRGPAVFAKFAKSADFPMLAANLDVSQDPDLKDLIKASTVIEVDGEKVGIVGATTEDLPTISDIGPHIKLKPIAVSVQSEVDRLTAQGITKIVLLAHCGFSEERQLAKSLRGVDVVLGGHSHTLVGQISIGGETMGSGVYPTVEKDLDGNTTLLAQAWEWGKIIGNLQVTFDDAGRVKSWQGAPVKVDAGVPEDGILATIIEAFQLPLAALRDQKIGESKIEVSRSGRGETLAGNLITDAMLKATQGQGAVAAFMNAGGIRTNLPEGTLTYGSLIEMQPFANTLVIMDLTGAEVKGALEHGAASGGGFLHISSGSGYIIDRSRPEGDRVSGIRIAGQPLDAAKTYKITVNSFTAGGGDAHATLKAAPGKRVETGLLDLDALIDYVKANSPIEPKLEGRIQTK